MKGDRGARARAQPHRRAEKRKKQRFSAPSKPRALPKTGFESGFFHSLLERLYSLSLLISSLLISSFFVVQLAMEKSAGGLAAARFAVLACQVSSSSLAALLPQDRQRDRKSTRLNSSHLVISYA